MGYFSAFLSSSFWYNRSSFLFGSWISSSFISCFFVSFFVMYFSATWIINRKKNRKLLFWYKQRKIYYNCNGIYLFDKDATDEVLSSIASLKEIPSIIKDIAYAKTVCDDKSIGAGFSRINSIIDQTMSTISKVIEEDERNKFKNLWFSPVFPSCP